MGTGVVEVPLRRRDGSVRAVAIVDEVDAERVLALRWSLASGYAARRTPRPDAETLFLHRFILGLALDDPLRADHINRDRLDNRRANLRIVTEAQNRQNLPAMGGASRFRGVSLCRQTGRWRATVVLDGRQRSCGRHDREIDAAMAAEAYRLKHMPFSEPDPELAAILERGTWREA